MKNMQTLGKIAIGLSVAATSLLSDELDEFSPTLGFLAVKAKS